MRETRPQSCVRPAVMLLFCAAGACSAPPRSLPAPDPAPTTPADSVAVAPSPLDEAYDVDMEGRFPPAPPVPPRPARGWLATRDDSLATSAPARPASQGPSIEATSPGAHLGYRVQVAACRTLEIAQGVLSEVQSGSDWPAYVQLEPPYYKVRVGNCATKDECSELASLLRAAGWESAWVVRTQIVSPR